MTINSTKNSDEFTSLKNKAETLMSENKLDEALSQYAKAIEIDPEYAEGYCNMGLIYLNTGEFEKAEKQLQMSIQKDPDMTGSYFNLGMLYQEQSLIDPEWASE